MNNIDSFQNQLKKDILTNQCTKDKKRKLTRKMTISDHMKNSQCH